jgi:hypothetical protein
MFMKLLLKEEKHKVSIYNKKSAKSDFEFVLLNLLYISSH